MKQNIITICMAGLVSALFLSACSKENQESLVENKGNEEKVPVSVLYAYDASSKTILGNDWSVTWDENDKLTVFNAASGQEEYSDNCRFVIDGAASEGKFIKDPKQATKELISGADSYDWYVCSPWMEYGANPAGTRGYGIAKAPVQKGYNSNSHVAISDIMAGVAYGVDVSETPSVALHHMGALMKFTVTNNTGLATAITGLSLDATECGSYIVGGFTMDWGDTSSAPVLSTVDMATGDYVCSLSVTDEAGTGAIKEKIADGESVDLYMVVAPFSIPAGGKIKLTLSGTLGKVEMEESFPDGITFAAGTYNEAALSYTSDTDPEKIVFVETFGTPSSSANTEMGKYDKSGLTTTDPAHKAGYTYVQASGSVRIVSASNTSNKINTAGYGDYVQGGVARFGLSTSANGVAIKGVTVKPNTTYIFKYSKANGAKSDGKEHQTGTRVAWRKGNTTDAFTYGAYVYEAGIISFEFNTGANDCIDILVQGEANPDELGKMKYVPAVDNLILMEK